jgi:hypothetical protein
MEHLLMRQLVLVEAVGVDSTVRTMSNSINTAISGQIMIVAMNSVLAVMDTVVAVAMVAGITLVVVVAMVETMAVAAMKPVMSAESMATLL